MAFYQGRSVVKSAKLSCVFLILVFYFLYSYIHGFTPYTNGRNRSEALIIQYRKWSNGTGDADTAKLERITDAMRHTWRGYAERAWGHDDIQPVTGGQRRTRNGWGAFIVDSSSTLALMGLWDELGRNINHIINGTDFDEPVGLVDPFETTIRYLGGMVSIVELLDHGVIPNTVLPADSRSRLVQQAVALADNILPAYDTPTGLPWPRWDFYRQVGSRPERAPVKEIASVGPARAGSNIMENCVLSNITDNAAYCRASVKSWSKLVWSKYIPTIPGLVDAPIDIQTGEPAERNAHWDGGHDSYYEYLLKYSVLFPSSSHRKTYESRFLDAASALRWNLSSRSEPTVEHKTSHLFMGKWKGPWYANEQSHLACFAPGTLLLGSRALASNYPSASSLEQLALALLEGCRHVYASTPLGIGPESWSWNLAVSHASERQGFPARWVTSSSVASEDNASADNEHSVVADSGPPPPSADSAEQRLHESQVSFHPQTAIQVEQAANLGFWVVDSRFNLRPEYVESLFYAYRITGDAKYRDWAWEAFEAMEKHCKTEYGFSSLRNVMADPADTAAGRNLVNEQESFWAAETLKYFWLIFTDVNHIKLEDWVFSTEGHPFRRRDA